MTNATGITSENFDIERNKKRGYHLYPPVQLATLAASALKQTEGIEIEILDLEHAIRQYFIESDTEEVPFSYLQRKLIKERSSGLEDTQPFGTIYDLHSSHYLSLKQSLVQHDIPKSDRRSSI